MNEEDLKKIGERRRLIFQNVANGVPEEKVCAAFGLSREEAGREMKFVAKKIAEYRHRSKLPPVPCDSITDVRQNRMVLLGTLSKIGPLYLSSSLEIPNLQVHKIETEAHLREAARQSHVRVNTI